jgi:hypothetical protein
MFVVEKTPLHFKKLLGNIQWLLIIGIGSLKEIFFYFLIVEIDYKNFNNLSMLLMTVDGIDLGLDMKR